MAIRIKVTTVNMDTNEIDSTKVIDHEDHRARVWLSKHCYWAFRNNHSVLTEPVYSGGDDD